MVALKVEPSMVLCKRSPLLLSVRVVFVLNYVKNVNAGMKVVKGIFLRLLIKSLMTNQLSVEFF